MMSGDAATVTQHSLYISSRMAKFVRSQRAGKLNRPGIILACTGLMGFSLWTQLRVGPQAAEPTVRFVRLEGEDTQHTENDLNLATTPKPAITTHQQLPASTPQASHSSSYEESDVKKELPVTSVLHPITPEQPPLNPNVAFRTKSAEDVSFTEYEEEFPQHGKSEPGRRYRIENRNLIIQPDNREKDSVLIMCVFNNEDSWGDNRSVVDFFKLVGAFDYPASKISISLLTSSPLEFDRAKVLFKTYIQHYPQLSTWHQHVVWVDADVSVIPPHLLPKMARSGLDILMPICYSMFRGKWINYDQNAWVGQRIVRPASHADEHFMPGPLRVKLLDQVDDKSKPFTPLDSVGGTMLYVRADVHRHGVMFPMHYVIGSEWGREGYDGIETEGLCYTAHFLGFKCWGMFNESIQHTDEF
ncbi:unnamed protein product [Phytophthora lilii]|uniref:Unnamed protein product n=1 Tax=Phytophthora lilii TaxID=2077276 RepID=A0A9W6WS62_9STRA|nr:unnamed protein product [Phytophthora lilii]